MKPFNPIKFHIKFHSIFLKEQKIYCGTCDEEVYPINDSNPVENSSGDLILLSCCPTCHRILATDTLAEGLDESQE